MMVCKGGLIQGSHWEGIEEGKDRFGMGEGVLSGLCFRSFACASRGYTIGDEMWVRCAPLQVQVLLPRTARRLLGWFALNS